MSVHPRWSVPRDCPDHEAGDSVDDDGYEEECKADLDERAEIQIAGRLGELARDNAGQRVGWGKEGLADTRVIADDHCDGHRLAKGTAQTQHDGADDAD